ncbi:MAG: pteridine reductase [marine bacterium B5-7]|nr:MAG: pteridine reductase [marine bacterium B5-7]
MPPIALITGSARRVGAVILQQFHAAGYRVILHYRQSKAAAMALVDACNAARPDSALAWQYDLSDTEGFPSSLQSLLADWGGLDVLVNNAAVYLSTPVLETTETEWQMLFDRNVKAPYFLTQACASYLEKNNGCVINIIDIQSQRAIKNYGVYAQTKAAFAMQTKSLARELAPSIRVNGISPGPTLWPEGENDLTKVQQEKVLEKSALHCLADPEDIGNAALYFAQAKTVTGQILAVDAGRSIKT